MSPQDPQPRIRQLASSTAAALWLALPIAFALAAIELATAPGALAPERAALFLLSAFARHLWALSPAVLLAVALGAAGWPRLALAGATLWVLPVAWLAAADAIVRSTTSNSIWFYLQYALEPEAWRVAGGAEGVSTALGDHALSMAALCLGTVLLPGLLIARAGRASPASGRAAGALAAFAALVLVLGPRAGEDAGSRPGAGARPSPASQRSIDELDRDLAATYGRFHAAASAERFQPMAFEPGQRPNVVVLLGDSLRSSMFTPTLMPRLYALSRRGARFETMYSTAIGTGRSLFGLIYGRSPLWSKTAKTQRQGAPWISGLQAAGYQPWYLQTSKMWSNIAGILPGDQLSVEQRIWGEGWQRDEQVLERTRELIDAAEPALAFVLLCSTHQRYSYPPRYESVFPADTILAGGDPRAAPQGCAFQPPDGVLRSNSCREYLGYFRASRYLDDLVSDFIEATDLSDTLVVFTGDHGESFGEDGARFHGSLLSDVQTRVPLMMLGPGIPEDVVITRPTSQIDLVPTLLDVLGVAPRDVPGLAGRSWFEPEERPHPYITLGRDEPGLPRTYQLMFVADSARYLVEVKPDAQEARYLGVLDLNGRIDPAAPPLPDARLLPWFEDFLRRSTQ